MTGDLLTLGLLAMAAAVVASILIVASRRWHGKHTLDHDLDGVQKFHTAAVPRIGGVAIAGAIAFTTAVCSSYGFALVPDTYLQAAALLLVAALPAFLGGIVEDIRKDVSVQTRLLAALLSALAASWLLGATLDQLDIWGVDTLLRWTPFALAVTCVVVAGGVNAINIIDGFNGLASSTVVVMLTAFAVIGWHMGDPLVTHLAVLGLGAAFGFLLVNFPTGRLFLGDGGAYFLGFWVAEVAVLLLVRNPLVNAWQVLAVCAYPVIEVLYSMYRRRILRQASPAAPDGLHLHTLVYRRVAPRIAGLRADRPWQRNAAVTCLIVPWVVASALLGVLAGGWGWWAIAIVAAQLLAYLTVYSRLVRGRWGSPFSPRVAPAAARPVVDKERERLARFG
ncbi:MAG: MraY family glycosyltransferase [Massilia sp.]